MKNLLLLVLSIVLFTSCTKPALEICGTVTGGDYDAYTNTYYLRVDGKKHWVDERTYLSFEVGSYVCLEDW